MRMTEEAIMKKAARQRLVWLLIGCTLLTLAIGGGLVLTVHFVEWLTTEIGGWASTTFVAIVLATLIVFWDT